MLSDGMKWAPETCHAECYPGLDSLKVCRGECGGLLLWLPVPGRGGCADATRWLAAWRLPATCLGSCPGLGCLPSGICACVSPPPLDWAGWCLKGSPGRICLCWVTHWGKAWPPRVGPQVSSKAKGLIDRQVGLPLQTWGCQPAGSPQRHGPASCSGHHRYHQPLVLDTISTR